MENINVMLGWLLLQTSVYQVRRGCNQSSSLCSCALRQKADRDLGELGDILCIYHVHGMNTVVCQIHDWHGRAKKAKNPHLKYLGDAFIWKTAPTERGNTGLVYKCSAGMF